MLFEHQKKIIADDPKICGLFLGTGSSKTRISLELAQGKTLIIAPKTQKNDENWERENKKWNINKDIVVLSKESFRRDHETLPRYDTLIFDEAHTILGVTPNIRYKNRKPIPKTSQLFDAALHYVQRTKPSRLYLVTATPTRSAMCVWGAGVLLGKAWDFYNFRDAFYHRLPMPGRDIWQAKKDKATKERLGKAVQKLGYTGKLSDWFDVPDQTHKEVACELTKEQSKAIGNLWLKYPDPLVLLGKTHQVENGVLMEDLEATLYFKNDKIERILELMEEFPKVLIFAKYKAQIEQIRRALQDAGIDTYVLTGETRDRKTLIADAEASERCAFIAQSQVSAGYELPSFRCTIFASMSYSHVDLMQAQGRTLRANKLAKNLYVYLFAGEIDHAVWTALSHKQDFNEAIYIKKK